MEARTIIIDAHAMRRHERVSALKELLAAAVLIPVGVRDLTSAGSILGPGLALVVGFSELGIGIIELKRGRKFGSWIRWLDIAVGGLLVLEGLTLTVAGYQRNTLIVGCYGLGASYVLAGLLHRQLGRRRYVRLDDDGVQVRMTPFRRFRVGWPDISRMVGHTDSIEIFAKGEKRYEIARRYVPNLDEIRELMLDRASGRGISTK